MEKVAKLKQDSSLVMVSMAFQDHWSKILSMGDHSTCSNSNKVNPNRPPKQNPKKSREMESIHSKVRRKRGECQEIVLETQNITLSLAEKMGLVESPASRNITESQWNQAKDLSNGRCDSLEPCPICKEYFSPGRQQVLLSCSHVFHLNCIKSYEKLSGRKSCPLCRAQDYQTRLIYEGEKKIKCHMATKIQSIWKMYTVRKWYLQILEHMPPKEPSRRRKFFEKKLEKLTNYAIKVSTDMESHVDSLFQEIDRNINASRKIMSNCFAGILSEGQWTQIEDKAISLEVIDCPVCLMPLQGASSEVALLSCSHAFHLNCIESYENFLNCALPACPLCRCPYLKKLVSIKV